MQTTATYYGAMHASGRGATWERRIRPKQKLGGGRQGDVRKIPSATKGRRAHPHMVEKKIFGEHKQAGVPRSHQVRGGRDRPGRAASKASLPIILTNGSSPWRRPRRSWPS